jgi:DNA-binding response OmpR family regulator
LGGDRVDASGCGAQGQRSVVTDQTVQSPEPLRVLLAEDDHVAAEIVTAAFARDPGLTVLHAADGGTALSLIQREHLAAAVLDIRMPVLDGLYLLLTIREDPRTAALPVVLMTSLGSEADVIRGFELGADDYVVKPFSPAELVARVQRLLGRRPSGRHSRAARIPDTESP